MRPINSSILPICITVKSLPVLALATADAVSQFQGVKGLTITGTVDALTYAALGPLGVGTDLNGDGVVGPNETIGD